MLFRSLSSTIPYMYTDKPEQIEFLADVEIIDQIIDWFGNEVKLIKTANETKVLARIKASPNAMEHWAMQYINFVEITAPESLRERIKEALKKGSKKYK